MIKKPESTKNNWTPTQPKLRTSVCIPRTAKNASARNPSRPGIIINKLSLDSRYDTCKSIGLNHYHCNQKSQPIHGLALRLRSCQIHSHRHNDTEALIGFGRIISLCRKVGNNMPETKRPLKVFLCHAHSDAAAVRALYNRLVKDGVDAWLDKEKLLPGQDWEMEIRKAVSESDVVVVCHSKQFNQAGFRQKEVRLALDTAMEQPEGEIFIIPARLEECNVLQSLHRWQWVDLFEDDGYVRLMGALRLRAEKLDAVEIQLTHQSPVIENSVISKKPYISSLRILVTGGRVVSKLAEQVAYLVGSQVIIRGHILISNGATGVDRASAEGALEICKEKSLSPEKLIQIYRPFESPTPNFNFGNILLVGQTYTQRKDYVVDNSDAVIILGGGSGTRKVANRALNAGKPLIPIGVGNSTEVAFELWQKMFTGVIDSPIELEDLRKIGHKQNIKTAAINALLLAENLARR